ncbi:MAG: HD domain-containing protein [Firmicutes bacterium]|nr:HD domain-containing protein [Bacillota bacterium]
MESAYLAYVRAYLAGHHADRDDVPGRRFRSRAEHIRRVAVWTERLMARSGVGEADASVLRLAAAFHDAGYARGAERHGCHGADILREYAARQGLEAGLVERAAFLVAEHSNKQQWLHRADAPCDLVLLMEADLLDEEGAMGLVRDCMNAGEQGAKGYEDAYACMRRYEPQRLWANPMVTPLARELWTQKQRLIAEFMAAFAYDLGAREGETLGGAAR